MTFHENLFIVSGIVRTDVEASRRSLVPFAEILIYGFASLVRRKNEM